jgi:cysteine desulfurase
MPKIYLNNNSSTKVDPEVVSAMLPYFSEQYGNPSNLHIFGRETREALEQAREQVASFINCKPEEIYFTSGGTEANNFAIKGILRAIIDKGNHIITSSIEHHSVLDAVMFLEKMRYIESSYLNVDQYGMVNPDDLKRIITNNTILVSIMHSNNEVGTIQPIKELCNIAHEKGVYFHTDAVAYAGKIMLDVADLGVDLLSLSAHKFHGPKGVGALYIKEGIKIEKFMFGGEQERGMRAGTENLPGIVGLGKAAVIAEQHLKDDGPEKIKSLRDYFEKVIISRIPDTKINGHLTKRYANISNISFAKLDSKTLLANLDLVGIMASAGYACITDPLEKSHVLKAMGVSDEYNSSQIRFGLSKYTTKQEIDYTIDILQKVVTKLRNLNLPNT